MLVPLNKPVPDPKEKNFLNFEINNVPYFASKIVLLVDSVILNECVQGSGFFAN